MATAVRSIAPHVRALAAIAHVMPNEEGRIVYATAWKAAQRSTSADGRGEALTAIVVSTLSPKFGHDAAGGLRGDNPLVARSSIYRRVLGGCMTSNWDFAALQHSITDEIQEHLPLDYKAAGAAPRRSESARAGRSGRAERGEPSLSGGGLAGNGSVSFRALFFVAFEVVVSGGVPFELTGNRSFSLLAVQQPVSKRHTTNASPQVHHHHFARTDFLFSRRNARSTA